MGRKAPPDLMESLGFGPWKPTTIPIGPKASAGSCAIPICGRTDMPEFRLAVTAYWRAMEVLSARLSRVFALALELDENFLRRPQRPPRHQHADQLLPGAGSAPGSRPIARGRAFGLWRVHDPQGRARARRPAGPAPRRRMGRRSDHRGRFRHQYRRSADALDQRQVGVDHPSRGQPARSDEAQRRPHVGRVFFVPNHDVEVRCIESCMGPHNPPRYAPVTAGAHWRGKILASRQISAKAS